MSTRQGAALSPDQQLALARRPEDELRARLAASPDLTNAAQLVLVGDDSEAVLYELSRNKTITRSDEVELALVEQAFGRTWERGAYRPQPTKFGEVAQLAAARHPGATRGHAMMMGRETSYASVQLALLESAGSNYQALAGMLSSGSIEDDEVWKVVRAQTAVMDGGLVAGMLGFAKASMFPEPFLDDLRARPELEVQAWLVGTPSVALRPSMRVDALVAFDRGRDFLETFAPDDRSTWDTLKLEWNGDVPSLVAACSALAPEPA